MLKIVKNLFYYVLFATLIGCFVELFYLNMFHVDLFREGVRETYEIFHL